MEKFNVQVNAVLLALQTKLADNFGAVSIDRKLVLGLAKEFGFLQGKRGREGGTFATETGMAFANLSGEIIRPVTKADKKAETMAFITATVPEVTVNEVP